MISVPRVLALWGLLTVSALVAADGYTVKRTPRVDDSAKYHIVCSIDANGSQGAIDTTVVEKVIGIDKDGNFTVEQSQVAGTYNFGDETHDMPVRAPITLTYKPAGQVSKITGDYIDKLAYRVENLGAIVDPGKSIAIGDAWEATIKADKDLGTRTVRAQYKLLAAEKVGTLDTLKIKASLKETDGDIPATNDFTVWISVADGSVVQRDSRWTNMPFSGSSVPISGTYKLTRVPS